MSREDELYTRRMGAEDRNAENPLGKSTQSHRPRRTTPLPKPKPDELLDASGLDVGPTPTNFNQTWPDIGRLQDVLSNSGQLRQTRPGIDQASQEALAPRKAARTLEVTERACNRHLSVINSCAIDAMALTIGLTMGDNDYVSIGLR